MTPHSYVFDPHVIPCVLLAAILPAVWLLTRAALGHLVLRRAERAGWWPRPYDLPLWWWRLRLAVRAWPGMRIRPSTPRPHTGVRRQGRPYTRTTPPTMEHT
jgi:hypothetical protein